MVSAATEPGSGGEDAQDAESAGVSAAASGPAGAHFEQQVAAFYLLAMLCGAPPRGMPGACIDQVKLQQTNDGHPLDDVILTLTDAAGRPASLEIQAKRTVTFAPTDKIFGKVVGQIVETAKLDRFDASIVEMAVATSRGSRVIEGAYQDILAMARQFEDGQRFAQHLQTPGVGNKDMRQLVATFKAHLVTLQAPNDDETVWRLLRRLQLLIFDFESPGSGYRDFARERCRNALAPEHVGRADSLWDALVSIAFEAAKRGGTLSRESLLEALKPYDFKLAGERRHLGARRALAESSRQALDDINIHVGDIKLSRAERLAEVREALNHGRYVEIRGEPGVGKSGVLRQLAEAMQLEGQVIVLMPHRCSPRGWAEMKSRIQFAGELRELLAELAADGGVTLLIDNLDFFSVDERATVVDFMREASRMTGISVLATARPGFGIDDTDWLPADAIQRLGHAKPIVLENLSEGELQELRARAPVLAPLLQPEHPARRVSANLFRLDRLARQSGSGQAVQTEIDLAEQWWNSADGDRDEGWRDRRRLLGAMGLHALAHGDAFDCSGVNATVVGQLRRSGTLKELAFDRVDFQHDVLREWAIALTLYAQPNLIDTLPLDKPASAALARGIELAARLSLERNQDGTKWVALVQQVSRPGAHRSWRRNAILAVTRSEAADLLLPRAQAELFADRGALLKELASLVSTVEVISLGDALGGKVAEGGKLSPSLAMPRGPGWATLIEWLLKRENQLPANAIPSVVSLFQVYVIGTFALGPLVTLIAGQLGRWLRDFEPTPAIAWNQTPPSTAFDWSDLDEGLRRPLKQDLHDLFLALSWKVPDQAQAYVRAVIEDLRHNERLADQIVLQPLSLPGAAPAEVAELSRSALMGGKRRRGNRRSSAIRDEAFNYLDAQFLPASPARGPFLALLQRDPQIGLGLIHSLVEHAVKWASRGADPGSDGVVLNIAGVERMFPWASTYAWSRESNHYAMTSALQALEAWAHKRIEAGDPVENVLVDALGPPGTCAAFLLIAVDMLICHWPKVVNSALPFLASPELLALELDRSAHDRLSQEDPLGMNRMFGITPNREPAGAVTSEDLRKRPSRRQNLLQFISRFMSDAPGEQGQQLVEALRTAVQRLGPYKPTHTLRDPPFMVRHALNQTDEANWSDVQIRLNDGRVVAGRQYTPPAEEFDHLEALKAVRVDDNIDLNVALGLTQVLSKERVFTEEELEAAIGWAKAPQRSLDVAAPTDGDKWAVKQRREAVVTVALLVVRDAPPTQRDAHLAWALTCFDAALTDPKTDHVLQTRDGLRYNPLAISFAGRLFALRVQNGAADVRGALMPVAMGVHEVAHGLGEAVEAVVAVDARLVKSLLRCALAACIRPRAHWNPTPDEALALKAGQEQLASRAVEAELAWLNGTGSEPAWPQLPRKEPRLRHRLRLPDLAASEPITLTEALATEDGGDKEVGEPLFGNDADEIEPPWFNHQLAALWLRQIERAQSLQFDWLQEMVMAFLPWTMTANGADLAAGEDAADPPREWNEVFFGLLARALPDDPAEALAILSPICRLSDQNFFDLTSSLTNALDEAYFGNPSRLSTVTAVGIRNMLADHLVTTWGWRWAQESKDGFTEYHLGYAIAGMFFTGRSGIGPSSCYLTPLGINRLGDFFPTLQKLVSAGPCQKVVSVLLNLLEVSPRPEHLSLLAHACRTWWTAYGDYRPFWIESGFGSRWCKLVLAALATQEGQHDQTLIAELAHLAAELVSLGVLDAVRLELTLTSLQQ